jgi:hypothetical protein
MLVHRLVGAAIKIVGCLVLLLGAAGASHADWLRYRGGLRNAAGKHQLNAKQLKAVLESLREKTGLLGLQFAADGWLVCPDVTRFAGGSASARTLLLDALNSPDAFELEAHNSTATVVFARLVPAVAYESRRTGARIDVYPLQLDFSDFKQLRGERRVLCAFDLGLVILHELAHGIWHLRDAAAEAEEPGECEAFINRIRRELDLPERATYAATLRPGRPLPTRGTKPLAELLFVYSGGKDGRRVHERLSLQWDAEYVGNNAQSGRSIGPALMAGFR